MEKQIELAKSWFSLAQILATIAGMLIVASGILMSIGLNSLNLMFQEKERLISLISANQTCTFYPEYYNVSQQFMAQMGTSISLSLELWKWFMWGGLALGILAIIFWKIGRINLK